MILSVHQPQYIPWVGYFDKIARSDAFVFLDDVQYKEREFQNRNKIRTRNGPLWLTVPVVSGGKGRQRVRDVEIEDSTGWRRRHAKSIETWYANAPYFSGHAGFFRDTYSRPWERLCELNMHITGYLLREFGITTRVYLESEIGTTCARTDRIIELCLKLGADTYLSGSGGRQYLEEEKFARAGVKLAYQDFRHPVYTQQFSRAGEEFLPYMSAIDLLFNEGPGSREIL